MTKIYTVLALLCLAFFGKAQTNFTANDFVNPYEGFFRPGVNLGDYISFTEEELADLSAGNASLGVPGVGVKALRPGLFEEFVATEGYESKIATYQHFIDVGLEDNTLIVGFPSEAHQDPEEYCEGKQSELFANLYLPIWDGGANGTPINEDNYYAFYIWKLVESYGDYVRFWEIWNEPGFDFTGGLGWLPPGAPGNWWENNPDPCDYKLRAPIFHYVRILRISWEVIKSGNPDDYVVVSGTGFPSFLDAILRNTDNPDDGSVSPEFPLGGGAYFDVMGYHAYPHFDGSLQEWSDDLNDFIHFRHSDAAAAGLLMTKDTFQGVLANHGYNGNDLPEKLWMITECNLPRKPVGDFIGSAEAQRNFIIKAAVICVMNDIWQLHMYKLAEDNLYENTNMEFELMGLYQLLDNEGGYFQTPNEEGIAYKTVGDLLFEKVFDAAQTALLNLPDNIGGGAFKDAFGNYTYVLWAETETDMSENANATYSFPTAFEINNLVKRAWDFGYTDLSNSINPTDIQLTGTPIFLTDNEFGINEYFGCVPHDISIDWAAPINANSWTWTLSKPDGSEIVNLTDENPNFNLNQSGTYSITLQTWDSGNNLIAHQSDIIIVEESPNPAFIFENSGPLFRFFNESQLNADSFIWDFGDGNTSLEGNPVHVYFESGTYIISLTASNECGSATASQSVTVIAPSSTMIDFTANDEIPAFTGRFKPSTTIEFYDGWNEEQLADICAGNLANFVDGIGVKAARVSTGEALFAGLGYDWKIGTFNHYSNLDLLGNSFLLDFPSPESQDPNYYCANFQSILFKDLYLDIWDNGENGTPINEENPFAVYAYHTVNTYKEYVDFWEVFNGPDFDFTGEYGWLPPGELGNWWENDPLPCQYSLRSPIYYYIRMLRIAYEVVRVEDPTAYVTLSNIVYPSFLDAVLRNTDNPVDGSVAPGYELGGGAYFDAIGYKSLPHLDGSTIFFDIPNNVWAFERHSDAAIGSIVKVKSDFEMVLEDYGYDGNQHPEKEWIITEANVPRKQIGDFMGSEDAQRNWVIKAWVESVKNDIRMLNIHRLSELENINQANDAFQVMGLFQKLGDTPPYTQLVNGEAVTLKTTSSILYATEYDPDRTTQLNLPAGTNGAAFIDMEGDYVYVLWAVTDTDMDEGANAVFSFPAALGIDDLYKRTWLYSFTNEVETISAQDVQLTGEPIFLTEAEDFLEVPIAHFHHSLTEGCPGLPVQYTDLSINEITSWNWSFPGGTPSTSNDPNPEVFYNSPGIYDVTLEVINSSGVHHKTLLNLVEIKSEPIADFDFIINGNTVTFNNLTQNSDSYLWDFGDLQGGPAFNTEHTYMQNGTYQVQLTAFGECGEDFIIHEIVIAAAPIANFDYLQQGECDDLLIQFLDASGSSPESWEWSIPDANPPISDAQHPNAFFPAPGFHEITLTVFNDFGMDVITETIYVEGAISNELNISLCEGDTYNGVVYENDTSFVENLMTSNLACDSTVFTFIEIVDVLETTISTGICAGEIIDGIPIFSDTTIIQTLTSVNGCDSISTLDIEVVEIENINTEKELCEGDFWQGMQWFSGGIFFETLTSSMGCDSNVTTEVFVFEVFESQIVDTIQAGNDYIIGDSIFTLSGNYEIIFNSFHNCDSTILLDLTVLDTTSNLIDLSRVGVLNFNAFPNPFFNEIHFEIELSETQEITLEIFDLVGRKIKTIQRNEKRMAGIHILNWTNNLLPAGVYFARLNVAGQIQAIKILKE